jgi:lysozyme
MSFNLGLNKLKKFKKMKAALDVNDYNTAADEMEDSLWFDQVKDRGPRMVNIMRTGFTD